MERGQKELSVIIQLRQGSSSKGPRGHGASAKMRAGPAGLGCVSECGSSLEGEKPP